MQVWCRLGAALIAVLVAATAAQAQDVSFAGKTVTVAVASGPAGSHAQYARLIARHMGQHLPGQPTLVNKYFPGAGGMALANQFPNQQAKDGTVFGIINRTIFLEPLINGPKAVGRFDPRKFSWIGSADSIIGVAIAWHTSKVKTYKDLLDHELIVAAVGTASGTTKEAYLLRNMFGFKFRVIMGYPDGGDVDLAMERGEVDGRANVAWPGLKNRGLKDVQEGRVRILYQMGLARHRDLPDVPLVMDFARNDREQQILALNFGVNEVGYSFVAPPDVPPAQLAALRSAFRRTLADPRFIEEANKQQLDANYVPPERLQSIFDGLYSTSPDLVAEWLRLTQPSGSEERARAATAKAVLAAVTPESIAFDAGGGRREARIDREQTAITIGGAKAAADALKVGLACAITYFGDKGTATSIACD